MAYTEYLDTVQKVYIAYYQRPADPAGLIFWAKYLHSKNGDLKAIIDAFATSAEANTLYGAINDTTIGSVIDKIYQALFNRLPDAAGKKFYEDGFKAGKFTAGSIALDILNGATGGDYVAISNKLQVANAFTKAIDPELDGLGPFSATYSGDTDAQKARDMLKGVTQDMATVKTEAQVKEFIKTDIAEATDPIQTQTTGQTFTLTAGTDLADTASSSRSGIDTSSQFKFTSGNEKIIAGAGTLGNADVLLDASTTDNDVLEATISGVAGTATLQNIETLKLNMAAGTAEFKMDNVSGAKTIEVTGAVDSTISGVGKPSAALTIKDYNKTLTMTGLTLTGTTATNDAETLAVTLSGAGAKAGLTLNGGANALETLKINSTGGAANTLTLGVAGGTTVDKIVVEGGSDLTLKSTHTLLTGREVVATDHTGTFTLVIDRDGAAAATSASNFAGVDTLVLRDSNTTTAETASVNNVADKANIVIATSFGAASAITVKGAASKTDNVINVTLDNETDATDTTITGGLTIADVETVNLFSEGAKTANALQLTADAAKTINIDGASKLTFTLAASSKASTVNIKGSGDHSFDFTAAAAYGEDKHLTVDASTATGKVSIDVSDFAGTAGGKTETATVLAGSGDNTITLGAAANGKYIVDAGGGKDTITVVAGSNVNLTTGAGSDTVKIDLTAPAATDLVITDFTAGNGGDVFSTKGHVAAVNFDKDGTDLDNGEIFVFTGAGLDGVTAANINAAGIAALGNGEKAILIVLNNNSGFAEVYALSGNVTAGWDAGDIVGKIATFENITTLTGLSALTADNFAVFA